jgi:hypothetical protein
MTTRDYHNQRGSILVYAMLTMAAMLAIGLTLNALFISKLRLAAAGRNATVALYAADSAVELCLFEARTGTDEPTLKLDNGATFIVIDAAPGNNDITEDCSGLGGLGTSSQPFGFRATGTYRGTSRALEISQ